MAFTRKMLKALGIEDEKIEQIIEAHTEVTDGLKEQIETFRADADRLKTVEAELEELKAKGDDGLADKYEKLEKEFKEYRASVETKAEMEAKEKAFRELLQGIIKDTHIDTVIDTRKAQAIIAEMEMADGKIANPDAISEAVRSNWGGYVATTTTKKAGAETPPANNGGTTLTKEQIAQIPDPVARRAAIAQNIEIFSKKSEE